MLSRRVLLAAIALLNVACQPPATKPTQDQPTAPAQTSSWAGSATCEACHPTEFRSWRQSHHKRAMTLLKSQPPEGDFSNRTFPLPKGQAQMSKRGQAYYMRLPSNDGTPREYAVHAGLGADPLQQYLLDLGDGRWQASSLAWDTRPKSNGGQRWFQLGEDQRWQPGDALHWTTPAFNWNRNCADCHTTGYSVDYDAATGQYRSQFAEPHVGCESCHGPAGEHVAAHRSGQRPKLGLQATNPQHRAWVREPGARIASLRAQETGPRSSELCAPCHARRQQLDDDRPTPENFHDRHRLEIPDANTYFADGQIKAEVFVYGSFLQSRMHAAGVECNDCHQPHSLRLRAEGNALCTNCHDPTYYDRARHHHHRSGQAGSGCVDCHMPTRLYMEVDGRRDHQFSRPRPQLSARAGSPLACTAKGCHAKENPAWASAALDRWGYTEQASPLGQALIAARSGQPGAAQQLRPLIDDPGRPGIARATALKALAQRPEPVPAAWLAKLATETDPLLRQAVAEFGGYRNAFSGVLLELLNDRQRSVRWSALSSLLDQVGPGQSPGRAFNREMDEYFKYNDARRDQASARAELARIARARGDLAATVREWRAASRLEPGRPEFFVNLADAQRQQGDFVAAARTLATANGRFPENAAIVFALGLSLIRQRNHIEALSHLERARKLAPGTRRYTYVLAIALHDLGHSARASTVLDAWLSRHPGDAELAQLREQWQK